MLKKFFGVIIFCIMFYGCELLFPPSVYEKITKIPESISGSSSTPKVIFIACGYNHTMVLKEDGTLWATGDNSYSQLGRDDISLNQFVQVQVRD